MVGSVEVLAMTGQIIAYISFKEAMPLIPLMNNTKWDELRLAMHNLGSQGDYRQLAKLADRHGLVLVARRYFEACYADRAGLQADLFKGVLSPDPGEADGRVVAAGPGFQQRGVGCRLVGLGCAAQ